MLETAVAIAIVVGLTQVVKKAFNMPSRFAPLCSLIFGIIIVFIDNSLPLSETIIVGIITGLSASGLYSGTKATLSK